jgi:hypothetical protein
MDGIILLPVYLNAILIQIHSETASSDNLSFLTAIIIYSETKACEQSRKWSGIYEKRTSNERIFLKYAEGE